jgi:hypothetical protein
MTTFFSSLWMSPREELVLKRLPIAWSLLRKAKGASDGEIARSGNCWVTDEREGPVRWGDLASFREAAGPRERYAS